MNLAGLRLLEKEVSSALSLSLTDFKTPFSF
jgi:hypothetical protein